MDIQKFLNYYLNKHQKVVSLIGPSGTGKSFSAEFMREYLGYKIAKQITTRAPRPDDRHYDYITPEEFVRLEEENKIFGFFDGDKNTFEGRGYGYLVDDVLAQLSTDKKLILFPSAYELEKPNFNDIYGTTYKIGLGFKDPNSVIERSLQCGKVMTQDELLFRVNSAKTLTHIMEKYAQNDKSFNLIYSDDAGDNLSKSKEIQLAKIVTNIGENVEDYRDSIDEFISREE